MSLFLKEIFYPYLTSIRCNKILFSITCRTTFNQLSCYFQSTIVLLSIACGATTSPSFRRYNSPFEGSQQEIFITFPSSFVSRHSSFLSPFRHTPPIAYALRPSAYSLFFRLETLFSSFFASLYCIMSQSLIYPFYTNRPRFV